MDHLGVSCSLFFQRQQQAAAKMVADDDERGALQEVDEIQYLNNVVRFHPCISVARVQMSADFSFSWNMVPNQMEHYSQS